MNSKHRSTIPVDWEAQLLSTCPPPVITAPPNSDSTIPPIPPAPPTSQHITTLLVLTNNLFHIATTSFTLRSKHRNILNAHHLRFDAFLHLLPTHITLDELYSGDWRYICLSSHKRTVHSLLELAEYLICICEHAQLMEEKYFRREQLWRRFTRTFSGVSSTSQNLHRKGKDNKPPVPSAPGSLRTYLTSLARAIGEASLPAKAKLSVNNTTQFTLNQCLHDRLMGRYGLHERRPRRLRDSLKGVGKSVDALIRMLVDVDLAMGIRWQDSGGDPRFRTRGGLSVPPSLRKTLKW
ncbi:hypothetical protein BJ508DRAFT_329432 [Ascobolus immersus RN42]|uniref:Uncharacterized protein n=1 Tax=Ascobolus immersus RN42 TaxID=1160509 RepID=A0A3N4I0S3_ASCIM|nr:hypothetical protein BJ508DRAFT_329432 [Ascobolus immersus RN42]